MADTLVKLQLVINEVSESSAQALQAVKLLAQYLGDKIDKVAPLEPASFTPAATSACMERVSSHKQGMCAERHLPVKQEKAVSVVAEWMADPACAGNAMTLLVAGIIYANEGNYVEALKACHTGLNLEMCAPLSPLAIVNLA